MKKPLKFIIIFLVCIICIAVIASFFLEGWLQRKINSSFQNKNPSLHVDKVHASLLRSSVRFSGVQIIMKDESININSTIEDVKITGIKYFKWILKKEAEADEISFHNLIFNGKQNDALKVDTAEAAAVLLRTAIKINKLNFDKINVLWEHSGASDLAVSVTDGSVTLNKLGLTRDDTLSWNSIENVDFKIPEIKIQAEDSMYTFKGNNIIYSVADQMLSCDSLSMNPNYSDYDFGIAKGFETDRMQISAGKTVFHKFILKDFISSNNLISQSIEIEKANVEVFRDRRVSDSHAKRPMLQEAIQNYPGLIHIDSVKLSKAKITYSEHAIKAKKPGKINFTEVNARLNHISNDSLAKKDSLILRCEGMLMGKSKIKAVIKAAMYDPDYVFTCAGSLASFRIIHLNEMLKNNAFVSVKDGIIESMDFNFTANKYKAKGEMLFRYDKMNIQVVNPSTGGSDGIKLVIGSFIANSFLIYKSNPLKNETVRKGIIDNERNPEKFIFNYCWRSILSGIKSTVFRKGD